MAHSRSPAIQNAALEAVGLPHWRYQLLPVPPEVFAELVPALAQAGFRGANVTIPHKTAALAVATQPTDSAAAIGAANTLTFEPGGQILADNSDAPALIAAASVPLSGASALVLGAGGSARAAVWALRHSGAEVAVWNRTFARARSLCAELGGRAVTTLEPADVLVNCTSVGLAESSGLEDLPLAREDLARFGSVIDFVYSTSETALIRAARELGLPAVDGLELLLGQGALSFERFTGRPAPLELMRAAARGGHSTAAS